MGNKSQKPLLTLSEQPGEHSNQFILTPSAFSPGDRFRMASKAFLLAITRALSKILGMTQSAEIVELFSYVPKRDKITEGVLFLMEKVRTNGQDLTKAQLVTAMFLADKTHLDADARPLFFDNYVATKNGPEGVTAMEMLDDGYDWTDTVDGSAPWTIERVEGRSFPRPLRRANTRRLSISDAEALESALGMVMALDSDQLRLFTHRNMAFAEAWNDGGGAGSRLDPRLVPDVRDDELIDDMLYASRHAYVAPYRK